MVEHCACCLLAEHLFEQQSVVLVFLCVRHVEFENFFSHRLFVVSHVIFNVFFETVNPTVSDTILELLFLSPQDFLGKERVFRHVKSFTQNLLLDDILFVEVCHLVQRMNLIHHQFQEFGVEERHSSFNTLCHHDLVCPQTVEQVQSVQFALSLFAKLFIIWCFVELQISSENLVSSFTRKHEFDPH